MKRFQLLIFTLLCLFSYSFSQAQEHDFAKAYGKTSKLLHQILQKHHYKPVVLNDALSREIFGHFIHNLDPESIYFTQEDLQQLAEYQSKIDDEILAGEASFLISTMERYRLALQRTAAITKGVAAKNMDFKAEAGSFAYSKKSYQDSLFAVEERLPERIANYIRYHTLKRAFADMPASNENANALDSVLAVKGEEYKNLICQQLQQTSKYRIEGLSEQANFVSKHFFGAITEQYDPHTNYFSFSEKKLFDKSLSDDSYVYGFSFRESKEGVLELGELLPGGPAWKSNELHEGDVLLEMKIEGGQTVDLSLTTPIRFRAILDSLERQPIHLTVRKKSGNTKTIRLEKEKISNENNNINSFILNGEAKIGYVSFPSFYTGSEELGSKGCANDLATQIIGLKRAGIDALIVDLRNNGGGSVQEAVDMVGMFIDVGPVMIEQDSKGDLFTRKDVNRGTVYNGPMVVLNNRLSASASEIFASAMQDYHRAVIVGGTSYGKATGQIMLPISDDILEELVNSWMTGDDMGFVKITIGKIFGITGKTHQLAGVKPDVPLYQATDAFMIGESFYPTALPSDSVYKKTYARPLPLLPIADLAAKSLARQNAHPQYQQIKKVLSELKEGKPSATAKVPLTPKAFYAYWKELKDLIGMIDLRASQDATAFKVGLSPLDQQILEVTPSAQSIYDIRMGKLLKDIDLEEAYRILQDLISIQNK